jgi:vesicle transport protein SEC22
MKIVGFDIQTQQAKAIVKRLDASSPARLHVLSKSFSISYVIENGLVVLVISDARYPQRLAFSFVKAVHDEFEAWLRGERGDNWRAAVAAEGKPYASMAFGKVLSRLCREYSDLDSKANQSRLQGELYEVQNIMRKNIEEVLDRGGKLDRACCARAWCRKTARSAISSLTLLCAPRPADVSKVSSRLVTESKQFKWGSQKLVMLERWKTILPWLIFALVLVGVVYWKFFL